MLKEYYSLTKPGIVYGNGLVAVSGFLLAFFTFGPASFGTFFSMLLGLSLVIASGCVFNNYIDRDIDKKMARTKKRPLITGAISPQQALWFASLLGVGGLSVLYLFVNPLTMWLALALHVTYVVLYGYVKRHSTLGTVVGSVPGALPPVIGYVAITNNLDAAALILFATMVCWQMPHFYAISIYRAKEYASAGIPVLPLKKGIHLTKVYMLFYIVAFGVTASLLTFFEYTGFVYITLVIILTILWLYKSVKGFQVDNSMKWARTMFGLSLIVLLGLSGAIAFGAVLP
ncbi:MAG TPA: heme o synthase [Candidatus Saccharimonadales bacterium]